jgi:hypothetical protein
MRMLSSGDGCSLVERDEDQCWLYKEEEEGMSSPAIYLSLVTGKMNKRGGHSWISQIRGGGGWRGKVAHTKEREDCSLSLAPVILRYGCKIRGTQLDGQSS